MPDYGHLAVDFSKEEKDLTQEALQLLVSRLYTSCTLRKFIGVLIGQVQELYDELIEMQRQRCLYYAKGEQLDAIGRIVGQRRSPFEYSEDYYFWWDRAGQGFDQAPWYTDNAPMGSNVTETDPRYMESITYRIVKNHTLVASIPELNNLFSAMLGFTPSYIKLGPYECEIAVPNSVSVTNLYRISVPYNTLQVDHDYDIAYPATFNLSGVTTFLPGEWFCFDRAEPYCFDHASWSVSTNRLVGDN